MRESWTDARLDDFSGHVDQRFDGVDADVRALREEMNERRLDRVDAKFEATQREMTNCFADLQGEMNHSFERMYRLMIQLGVGVGGGIIAALVGVIATQI